MGYLVRMPQMGMEMDQGEVVAWEHDEGDEIKEGDVLVVVESEKAANEVEAREDGVLREILVSEGETVEPGTPIGILAAPDEDLSQYESEIDTAAGSPARDEPATEADAGAAGAGGRAAVTAAAADQDGGGGGRERPAQEVKATPGARQLAAEEDVDLTTVEGTGPQGVVTEDDVAARVDTGGGGATRTIRETRDLTRVQETVSDRLGRSYRNAVHVTVKRQFDAGTLRTVRDAAVAADVDVSVSDLLIRALGEQLAMRPAFNALFENGQHKLVEEVNIGVAVDVDDGLVTPVVPTVTNKTVEEVSTVRSSLTERALAGDFTTDDLAGGTFTVTNLGPFGVDSFDPVIDPPQVAILGVGRIRENDSMTLSLSFDHRVVNGADAARFLDGLVEILTDPLALVEFFEIDLLDSPTVEVSLGVNADN